METKALSVLKQMTLSLDVEEGVSREAFSKVSSAVRKTMGADAAMVLDDAMEVGMAGEFYFPAEGDGSKVWKRMLVAYHDEVGLDTAENLVG